MDTQYAQAYRELYEKHWWWRAREDAIVALLSRLEPPQGWVRILDVGCGDGLLFDRLAHFGEVEDIELAAALVSAENQHRERIHIGPFDQSFRPVTRYSLILMLDVLEHLQDPSAVLRHALELLTPDGKVLITVPAFNLLWTNHDTMNHHVTRYTRRSFRALACASGLRIEMERYWFQWTCPVKLGVRVVERMFDLRPTPPGIPSAWLNRPLYALTRLECKLASAMPMPFGSSLVVVGRKSPA